MRPFWMLTFLTLITFIYNANTANYSISNNNCFYGFAYADSDTMVRVCSKHQATLNDVASVTSMSTQSLINSIFVSSSDLDFLWILIAGFFVFFMQTGFSLLEAGMVKHTNVQNILFKNIMDTCISGIFFYIFGYCIAFGDDDSDDANGFIGTNNIGLKDESYNFYFFQWAFSTTAATIVSGCVAERLTLPAYFYYTAWLSIWIYPVVVHWMWSGTGWLSPFNVTEDGPAITGGVIDFAGSGVVHMVGGWSGLMGAIFLGPRLGRFDEKSSSALKQQFMMGHHVPYQVLGTFILWFGWFGFNPGSTLLASGAMDLAGKVAVNTTIAAAVGGITVALINRFMPGAGGFWSIPSVCNGTLAGLVSITAPCSVVAPWASVCIGLIGGFCYHGSATLLEHLKIDDPLDAFSVHGACGMWGILCVAFFAYDEEAIVFGGYGDTVAGLNQGYRFGIQLLAIVSIAGWTIVNSGLLFALLKFLKVLRVDIELEKKGLDVHEHGGKARAYAPAYVETKSSSNIKIQASEQKSDAEVVYEETNDVP